MVSLRKQLSSPSFLFSFRVPSETRVLRRAFSTDAMDCFSPKPEMALVGVREIVGEQFLIANRSWRKNLTSGCILRRPCFCSLRSPRAAKLCPVRAFWPLIRRRVAPGQLLFQSVNRRNFNRILEAITSKLAIPKARRYSSHAFRRGTIPRPQGVGFPWAVVASSGIWRPPAFRGYVDLPRDVELGIQQLLRLISTPNPRRIRYTLGITMGTP